MSETLADTFCDSLAPGLARPRPLRVAIVDEELPYPLNSGKRIRTVGLLLRLARRHQLTYLCHRNSDPAEARAATEFLNDHGIATVLADRVVPPKSVLQRGPKFYAGLAANLFSPLPYVVKANTSQALRRAVQSFAERQTVDLWQCEWTPYAEVLRVLKKHRPLVMAHNIESLIWQRYHETEPSRLKRWYIREQWRKFEQFERHVFNQAACVVAVSDDDALVARNRFGTPRVAVIDNGVDTAYFRPADDRREANRILFLGSLDWRPNLDGVQQLLDQVFPEVLAREPQARLEVVGRNPPAWLAERVRHAPHVELLANVADVRPHLRRCGALAVPLRVGGGSRLKILEALAAGTPVISTRIGAEGLHLEAGRHLVVVDRVEDMAAALLRHIRTPGPALAMAASARRLVVQRYDWSILADRLEQIWHECSTSSALLAQGGTP
jgi:polysaccharide biosynthesis protein PslH